MIHGNDKTCKVYNSPDGYSAVVTFASKEDLENYLAYVDSNPDRCTRSEPYTLDTPDGLVYAVQLFNRQHPSHPKYVAYIPENAGPDKGELH